MSAANGLLGKRLIRFFIAAATAVTLFVGAALVLQSFPSLGSVELTKGPKADPTKCKDSDPNDGNQGGGNSGKGPKGPTPKPKPRPSVCILPTPSASPVPSPSCTPGGYGQAPGCPTAAP